MYSNFSFLHSLKILLLCLKFIPMNPSSLSWFNLKVQKQKSMYKGAMFLRMRVHRTPLIKNNILCEVTNTT